jgi:hypothetical protein
MIWTDAFSEMLVADHKVRRRGWENKNSYLKITDGKIYIHSGYGFYDLWNKPMSDIRAKDWDIYLP